MDQSLYQKRLVSAPNMLLCVHINDVYKYSI